VKNKIVILNANNTACSAKVLIECMKFFEKAYVVFSSCSYEIDYSTLAELIPFIKSERLNFIQINEVDELGEIYENSIEYAIACLAGQLSTSLPKKSIIEIRSNNSMSLSIVSLLKTVGIRVELINNEVLKIRSENELNADVEPNILENNQILDLDILPTLSPHSDFQISDEYLFENMIDYSITLQEKLNITPKRKPKKYVLDIINIINTSKFYRSDINQKTLNIDYDIQKNPVNTIYKYLMIYFQNVESKGLKTREKFESYFYKEHYLTKHVASQLLHYMISCHLISISKNKFRMKVGTLAQLETLNSDIGFYLNS
jgi:hypothetical protein